MEEGYDCAVNAVSLIVAGEVDTAMNEYNKKIKKSWILPLHWMAKKHISMPIS